MLQGKRDYYISRDVILTLISNEGSAECYVQTKDNCDVEELTSSIEKTDSEVGRHDLAILYKTATITGHTFQLSFDFVDYGENGLDYEMGKTLTQINRQESLKNGSVLIYDASEEKDKNITFYKVDVLADDTGVQSEMAAVTDKIDIAAVIKGLQDGTVIILPVTKGKNAYESVIWSKAPEDVFTFHSEYLPAFYTNVSQILNAKVTVPKDFLLYDFFVMNKKTTTDALGNSWVSLSYGCCLNTLDLLELDNTGKAHMYILDNFKDIDKHSIYESFLHLNKNDIRFETILRVIEKVQPESTKWVEDYIIEEIKSKQTYFLSEYIDTIVKYVRVSKKSKDRDIERFLDMMLHHRNYSHIEGYVRILKALKLKDTELAEYVQKIISEDKAANCAGQYAASFISCWKTESFKELEDYIYEGIKAQEICEMFKDCNRKTDEERKRHGLNTDYDFVTNYLSLLHVKGINKVNLIERYIQGAKEDAEHFPILVLLDKLNECINRNDKDDSIVPLFVKCIVLYDTYGEYAKKYIPKEKQKELGMSYSSYTYYTDVFEPYIDVLSKVIVDGKQRKTEKEREERHKDFEKRFKNI